MLLPDDALAEAQRLLDSGLPFHAHEVLEGTWKASVPDERALWQGLAQLAVALTHLARGNARGAALLLRRGRDRIAGYRPAPYGIDVPALVAWATEAADQVGNSPGPPSPHLPPLPMPRLAVPPRPSS